MPDTIAAIATGHQVAAIGILRLSGDMTLSILDAVFRPVNGKPLSAQSPRKMVYGDLTAEDGTVVDHALCVYFPAPNSYTGEDCAEIHCHGGLTVLDEGLSLLFAHGARQATGGEFTRRAFLNGRMDLMQAESVVDLIDAETPQAAHNAAAQLGGALSRGVFAIYDDLMTLASRFYAVVDYPDEDIEDDTRTQMLDTLMQSEKKLTELLATFSRGKLLKTGVPTVILGRPNAGKSSLLNALLGYDRAIVTDVPGTTRDTVEEKVRLDNVLLRLIDTAGIRNTADTVEAIGVDRAKEAAAKADLCLLVLDGSAPLTPEDEAAITVALTVPHLVTVVNKSDLPCVLDVKELSRRFPCAVSLSAKTGEGLSALCEKIVALYPRGAEKAGELLTNARQAEAVSRALAAVTSARASLESGMTPDAVLTDAESAMNALGELTGKNVRDDLVQTIFSRFCVGK